ncbi:DUF3105 domain-containing protein [Nitriliruptoraceae bacterium ZYF776]|nr:DUF3105 domain-containing protein [Profundirhabdus halotolerans]
MRRLPGCVTWVLVGSSAAPRRERCGGRSSRASRTDRRRLRHARSRPRPPSSVRRSLPTSSRPCSPDASRSRMAPGSAGCGGPSRPTPSGSSMADRLPPHRHGPTDPGPAPLGPRFRRSFRRFVLAAVVVLVVGLGAGVLFGRGDPERAARLVVGEFTVEQDAAPGERGPDPQLPTSGPDRGAPSCGVADGPVPAGEQVATLAAGVVVLQHDPGLPGDDLDRVRALASRGRVLVAPSAALADGEVVVATSWRHRMGLSNLDVDLLDAFVTGHADRAPDLRACPTAGP